MEYDVKTLEFEELAKPLIKFLCDNYNPHARIIISLDSAELLSGEMGLHTNEFIKDEGGRIDEL